ncbi:MAG: hypothetical protein NZ750_00575 [Anaerolineae bacterium]|nr:hypothetical protein [Anaerolineae bacterium]MDW8173078.1 uroporphyrinogen decarboxylase family protein [Anaerolineae bacterium]
MSKRSRLEQTLLGQPSDRTPIALWRHFGGDDQRAADHAHAVLWYQSQFEWDFVVAAPSNVYSVSGYGLQDAWTGDASSQRTIVQPLIQRSLQWTELRPLDPLRGELGKLYDALNLISDVLQSNATPLLPVIYSPLAQALRLAGRDQLLRHLRTQPDRLHSGLNTLTETTLRQIDSFRRLKLDGICYVVELADTSSLSEAEYLSFGLPYDSKIMDALSRQWWLNILRITGSSPMLRLFVNYPVQAIQWHTYDEHPSLDEGLRLWSGAVVGGLSSRDDLLLGTPPIVRDAARRAIQISAGRRLILSAEGPHASSVPLANLLAARDVVKPTGG